MRPVCRTVYRRAAFQKGSLRITCDSTLQVLPERRVWAEGLEARKVDEDGLTLRGEYFEYDVLEVRPAGWVDTRSW